MIKKTAQFLLLFTTISIYAKDLIFLDGIKVVIFTNQAPQIITHSDLLRPSLDGSIKTLDEMISYDLWYAKALDMHIASGEDVDKQLEQVLAANNLSKKDFEEMLKATGRTLQEGKEEFAKISAVNQVIAYIGSQVPVSQNEVDEYLANNPELFTTSYYIARAVVPQSKTSPEKIEAFITSGAGIDVVWSEPFWVQEKDLAIDKSFITKMTVCERALAPLSGSGYELFTLLDKKHNDPRPQVIEQLRRAKYAEHIKNTEQELRNAARIVYFD